MTKRIPLSQPVQSPPEEPSIPVPLRAVVIYALRWAWQHLRLETSIDPMTSTEEEVTDALEFLLNVRRNGRRRATMLRLFTTVERSGQHRSAGRSFRQTPDLTFRPKKEPRAVVQPADWGIFVECKIIGPLSNHSPRRYCTHGVRRFVRGDYAPRMNHGLMVAYVRDDKIPAPALSVLLAEGYYMVSSCAHETDDRLFGTIHDRGHLANPCSSINIDHLWLDARPDFGPIQLSLDVSS